MHGGRGPVSDPAALAGRPDFGIGDARVRPSLREIVGPAGTATVEPRVMQVLLALADAGGAVLTRDALLGQCWPGQIVGDDALTRTVFEIRRALTAAGVAAVAVHTVPKTGYRLTGAIAEGVVAADADRHTSTRRGLISATAVAVAAAAGFSGWRFYQDTPARRAAALVDRASALRLHATYDNLTEAATLLKQATALAPGDARAWGRLALVEMALSQSNLDEATPACRDAARRALVIDPDQADAAVSLAILPPYFGDWRAAGQRFAQVLAAHPDSPDIAEALVDFGLATGSVRAADRRMQGLVDRRPESSDYRGGRVITEMAVGNVAGLGRALAATPARGVGPDAAELWYLAWTRRTDAALARLDSLPPRHPGLPEPLRTALRATLVALSSGGSADHAIAVRACLNAGTHGHTGARSAITWLGALGAVNAAFAVADGYLLKRGPMTVRFNHSIWPGDDDNDRRRASSMLFLPQTRSLRADARFLPLCRAIGLFDYWRASGQWPDFLGNRAIA